MQLFTPSVHVELQITGEGTVCACNQGRQLARSFVGITRQIGGAAKEAGQGSRMLQ
jgi:hypothetical protein